MNSLLDLLHQAGKLPLLLPGAALLCTHSPAPACQGAGSQPSGLSLAQRKGTRRCPVPHPGEPGVRSPKDQPLVMHLFTSVPLGPSAQGSADLTIAYVLG